MGRPAKHEHQWAVISHYLDWTRVLVGCQTFSCIATEMWQKGRVRIAPRKFRDEEEEEFQARFQGLPHLCC